MPRSRRYHHLSSAGEVPGTLQRSPEEAQAAFRLAPEDAVRVYGQGEQADRAAYAVLKMAFEKCGDHWAAKAQPVGLTPGDLLARHGRSGPGGTDRGGSVSC